MRKIVLLPLLVFTAVMLVAAGTSPAGMHEGKATVKLSASPNVKTAAGGEAAFMLGKDGAALHYKLDLDKIENVTMAHIHAVAEGGKPGQVIAWLYPVSGTGPSLREGSFSGTLAEGDITPDKLAGAWKGKPVKDLLKEIETGKAGVAIHTKQNPGGELWGVHMGKEMKKM